MLAARSIRILIRPVGVSGIYVASLLEQLGIAVEMKPKSKLFPPSGLTQALLAATLRSDSIKSAKSWLNQPSNWQVRYRPHPDYTQFAPGIVTSSSQVDAGRALVTFLSSPASQTVLKAKGFE